MAKTILVVDDDPMNLKMADFILKKASYEVILAASGSECLDKLKENSVDLVLLDIEMPQMSGIQTLEQIRAEGSFADLRVVFLSASGEASDMQKADSLGAMDYVKKPFLPPALLECVEKALNK
ncbi:MAG: response regulator [Lachnospiraceae bacterium]|nr:response regulator [Lachnospiraceae bacterium]